MFSSRAMRQAAAQSQERPAAVSTFPSSSCSRGPGRAAAGCLVRRPTPGSHAAGRHCPAERRPRAGPELRSTRPRARPWPCSRTFPASLPGRPTAWKWSMPRRPRLGRASIPVPTPQECAPASISFACTPRAERSTASTAWRFGSRDSTLTVWNCAIVGSLSSCAPVGNRRLGAFNRLSTRRRMSSCPRGPTSEWRAQEFWM